MSIDEQAQEITRFMNNSMKCAQRLLYSGTPASQIYETKLRKKIVSAAGDDKELYDALYARLNDRAHLEAAYAAWSALLSRFPQYFRNREAPVDSDAEPPADGIHWDIRFIPRVPPLT